MQNVELTNASRWGTGPSKQSAFDMERIPRYPDGRSCRLGQSPLQMVTVGNYLKGDRNCVVQTNQVESRSGVRVMSCPTSYDQKRDFCLKTASPQPPGASENFWRAWGTFKSPLEFTSAASLRSPLTATD